MQKAVLEETGIYAIISFIAYMRRILLLLLLLSIVAPTPGSASEADQIEARHSIILLIGDGMGWNQILSAAMVEYGGVEGSVFDEFDYIQNITTKNSLGFTTDSAAAATAIATGVKVNNGKIGVNNRNVILPTILEYYESQNFSTGLLTTVYMQHATPAAFAAHRSDRDQYQEIAQDMSNAGVDLLLGGGSDIDHFGSVVDTMQEKGYTYVQTENDLAQSNKLPILGLFSSGSLPDEQTRTEDDPAPQLSTMTQKALELLHAEDKPFFLMVEGGKIDWKSHDNDFAGMVHEMIEFEKAVRAAHNFIKEHPDSLLIVTADHETGGLKDISSPASFSMSLPKADDSYAKRIEKRNSRAEEMDYTWAEGGHSNQKVILGTFGHKSATNSSFNHHIDTFSLMLDVFKDNLPPDIDISTIFTGTETVPGAFLDFQISSLVPILLVALSRHNRSRV